MQEDIDKRAADPDYGLLSSCEMEEARPWVLAKKFVAVYGNQGYFKGPFPRVFPPNHQPPLSLMHTNL